MIWPFLISYMIDFVWYYIIWPTVLDMTNWHGSCLLQTHHLCPHLLPSDSVPFLLGWFPSNSSASPAPASSHLRSLLHQTSQTRPYTQWSAPGSACLPQEGTAFTESQHVCSINRCLNNTVHRRKIILSFNDLVALKCCSPSESSSASVKESVPHIFLFFLFLRSW